MGDRAPMHEHEPRGRSGLGAAQPLRKWSSQTDSGGDSSASSDHKRRVQAAVARVCDVDFQWVARRRWDRPVQTLSEQRPASWLANPSQHTRTESWTTRRERRVPPDRIAHLARGEALVMVGSGWELVPTLPYHQHPTFAPIAQAARLSADRRKFRPVMLRARSTRLGGR
jgi:hypothetical protein